VALVALCAGCALSPIDDSVKASPLAPASDAGRAAQPGCVAARATPPRVDASRVLATDPPSAATTVLTWNLDWFGDPSEGPVDDATQYSTARDVLAERAATLVALEEVASAAAFERLLDDLPAYAGVLSGYSWTQKTALLWDRAQYELERARAVEGLDDAGRPPLLVELRHKLTSHALRVLVIHAKAQADAPSYEKRAQLALGLEALLDAAAPLPTIIVGDFNDLLQGSITAGADTPYRPLLADPAYAAPTLPLDDAGARERSFAHGQGTIDHVLVTPATAFAIEPASVDVLQDELLARYPSFSTTVSDHFPVTLALRF